MPEWFGEARDHLAINLVNTGSCSVLKRRGSDKEEWIDYPDEGGLEFAFKRPLLDAQVSNKPWDVTIRSSIYDRR